MFLTHQPWRSIQREHGGKPPICQSESKPKPPKRSIAGQITLVERHPFAGIFKNEFDAFNVQPAVND